MCVEQNALAKSDGKPCDNPISNAPSCLPSDASNDVSSIHMELSTHQILFCSDIPLISTYNLFTEASHLGLGLSHSMHAATAQARESFAFQPRFKLFPATFPIWSWTIFSIMFATYFICRIILGIL